jgi:hypothetical protein
MCRDNARPAGRGDVLRSGGAAILRRSGSACAKPPERDGSSPMQEFRARNGQKAAPHRDNLSRC